MRIRLTQLGAHQSSENNAPPNPGTSQQPQTIHDQENPSCEVKGPEGKIRVLKVGSDVKNLAAVKKGDQVVVRHTEEVAIDVTE